MAKPMSKSKIVAHLAEKVGTPKKDSQHTFFEELFKLAVKECKGGAGKFVIPNLGRAVKAHRKARMGRNPQTGEAIKIKAKTVVRLRAGEGFQGRRSGANRSPDRASGLLELQPVKRASDVAARPNRGRRPPRRSAASKRRPSDLSRLGPA